MTPDGRARPADTLDAAAVGGISAIPAGAAAVTDCSGSSLPAGRVAGDDVAADADSADASRAEAWAPATARRNADGPSEAGLSVADFALLRERFPVGDSDAARAFADA